jgi:hypothetical protein
MEIDFLDLAYPSDYYISKIVFELANIYTRLTKRLMAMEKLVLE